MKTPEEVEQSTAIATATPTHRINYTIWCAFLREKLCEYITDDPEAQPHARLKDFVLPKNPQRPSSVEHYMIHLHNEGIFFIEYVDVVESDTLYDNSHYYFMMQVALLIINFLKRLGTKVPINQLAESLHGLVITACALSSKLLYDELTRMSDYADIGLIPLETLLLLEYQMSDAMAYELYKLDDVDDLLLDYFSYEYVWLRLEEQKISTQLTALEENYTRFSTQIGTDSTASLPGLKEATKALWQSMQRTDGLLDFLGTLCISQRNIFNTAPTAVTKATGVKLDWLDTMFNDFIQHEEKLHAMLDDTAKLYHAIKAAILQAERSAPSLVEDSENSSIVANMWSWWSASASNKDLGKPQEHKPSTTTQMTARP